MRPYELPEQARFAHARLTDHRNDLTVASLRLLERAPESLHLGAPAHESGESPVCRRLESRTRRASCSAPGSPPISPRRPTNGESPRCAAAWSRVRAEPTPISS